MKENNLLELIYNFRILLALLWLTFVAMGMAVSIFGPSLPTLAINTDISLARIGFIYTARSIGYCSASLMTGFIFRRLVDSRLKLLWLVIGATIMATSIAVVPHMRTFAMLLVVLTGFGIGTGILETAGNILVIYLFGVRFSRSVSHSLFLCIIIGCVITSLVMKLFLKSEVSVLSTCRMPSINRSHEEHVLLKDDVILSNLTAKSDLSVPYVLIAAINLFIIIGFSLMILCNYQLPKYGMTSSNHTLSKESVDNEVIYEMKFKVGVTLLFFFFNLLFVGQSTTFWNYSYAFGLCSNLQMNVKDAALLATSVFAGCLLGRCSGVVLARYLAPRSILLAELLGCMCSTIGLSSFGEYSNIISFILVACYGFSSSMVLATGITWIAELTDVTGLLSSISLVGAYFGISSIPPLSGALLNTYNGPIKTMYFMTGISVANIGLFLLMEYLSSFKVLVNKQHRNISMTQSPVDVKELKTLVELHK